jgi:transcriptional regulator with XRE-family HTH domain
MDDARIGAAFRAVRIRRRLRQADVAARAGVSQSLVSQVERGHFDRISLAGLRRIGRALDIRIDIVARWRGGELDRMLSRGHSLLAESVVASFARWDGWLLAPEVSFSIWGERGIIDLLAFHAPTATLLIIELKTVIVDVNELIGTLDRKTRLAVEIAAGRGWQERSVSRWVIVERTSTNQRRLRDHRSVLRASFPDDGRALQGWLPRPRGSVSALSSWSPTNPGTGRRTTPQRVRVSSSRIMPR